MKENISLIVSGLALALSSVVYGHLLPDTDEGSAEALDSVLFRTDRAKTGQDSAFGAFEQAGEKAKTSSELAFYPWAL
ncbi:MAG: hypothetical protein M1548_09585 [Actinobacteria bacterium]|nr:hypothetical protein [Actinomycetota bacterium]